METKDLSFEEIEKALGAFSDEVEFPETKRAEPIFIGRLFQLIIKKSGEIIETIDDLPMNSATRIRRERRAHGFAVDMIETSTIISATKKEIVFTPKNYVPALEGRIPGTVEMSEQRAMQKRIENHSNMVKKMARNRTVKETVDENIKIYSKETNEVVFIGNHADTVKFLLAHPDFKISEHIAYLPEKVVNKLKRNDQQREWDGE